jgi:hypothetical protein
MLQTPAVIKLLRTFDPDRLRADAERLLARFELVAPPEYSDERGWRGLSLNSRGGKVEMASARMAMSDLAETPALAHAPYLRAVLAALPAPKGSVRMMALPPGATIRPHVDTPLNFQAGVARLHVPIVTHPDVEFIIDGLTPRWEAGDLWWADFTRLHSVANRSPIERINLIIDTFVTEELLALFPPEFVASQRALGISFHRPPIALEPAALARFACRFVLPGGVLPPAYEEDAGGGRVRALEGPARIELVGDGLVLLVAERPALRLVPVSPRALRISGGAPGWSFEFEDSPAGAPGVTIVLRGVRGPADGNEGSTPGLERRIRCASDGGGHAAALT